MVAAELVGTNTGLGAMIFTARSLFRIDVFVVGVIRIALLGVLMDLAMRGLETWLIPWRTSVTVLRLAKRATSLFRET